MSLVRFELTVPALMEQLEGDWLFVTRFGVSHPKFSLRGEEESLNLPSGLKEASPRSGRGSGLRGRGQWLTALCPPPPPPAMKAGSAG